VYRLSETGNVQLLLTCGCRCAELSGQEGAIQQNQPPPFGLHGSTYGLTGRPMWKALALLTCGNSVPPWNP